MKKCSYCLQEQEDKAKFCKNCGMSLIQKCPNCGNPLTPDAKFCQECGAGIKEKERLSDAVPCSPALTTILSADIQSSTETIRDKDVEEARNLLDQFITILVDCITDCHGEVLGLTGDGLVAIFKGENSGLQACYASAEVQKKLLTANLPLSVRIGLHSVSSDDNQKDLLQSSDVKIAQLIEAKAPQNGVQISYRVYDLCKDHLETGAQENIIVPDKTMPVASYTLRSLLASANEFIERPISSMRPDGDFSEELLDKERPEGERKIITCCFIKLIPRESKTVKKERDHLVATIKEVVKRFEGTFIKEIGDSILVIFGAPILYEDHPLRACLFSYLLHQEVIETKCPFDIRIGINTGEAVIDIIGAKGFQQYDVLGVSVNLAARMMQTAVSDQIQVSQNTFAIVEKYIHTLPLGQKLVKGLSSPLETYALVGINRDAIRKRLEAQFYGRSTFVGRKEELELFETLLSNTKMKQSSLLSFKAEPGIGKTRLVYECSQRAIKKGAVFYSVSSSAYEKNDSFSTLRLFTQNLFGISISSGNITPTQLNSVLNRLHDVSFTEELARDAIINLLGGMKQETEWTKIAPSIQEKILFTSLLELIRYFCKNIPIILIFEDLQWCDPDSLRFLTFFSPHLSNLQAMLLLDYRPDFMLPDSMKALAVERLLLPLSIEEAMLLINDILPGGNELNPLREMILSSSEGNPFFIEEFVKTLISQNAVEETENGYILTHKIQLDTLPENIQSLIGSRIDQLSTSEKKLLQQASILGRVFYLSHLRYISKEPEESFNNLMNALCHKGFIGKSGLFPEPEYTFKHALICDTAYNTMLSRSKRKYHGRLVENIEAAKASKLQDFYPILSRHAYLGELWSKAIVYTNLNMPNETSIDFPPEQHLMLGAKVKHSFEQLNETEKKDVFKDYSRVILLYIHALFITHEVQAALQEAHRHEELAKVYQNLYMELFFAMWPVATLAIIGKATQAYSGAKKVLSRLDEAMIGVSKEEALDLQISICTYAQHPLHILGHYDEFDVIMDKMFALDPPSDFVSSSGVAMMTIAFSHYYYCNISRARLKVAEKILHKYFDDKGRKLPLAESSCGMLYSLGVYQYGKGYLEDAKKTFIQTVSYGEQVGNELFYEFTAPYESSILFYKGNMIDALNKAREHAAFSEKNNYFFAAMGLAKSIEVLALCDAVQEALDILDKAIPFAESDNEKPFMAELYRVKALTYNLMAEDETYDEEILKLLNKAKEITNEIGCNFQNPFIHLTYSEFYTRLGKNQDAQEHYQQALDYFKEYEMTGWYEHYSQR